MCEARVLGWTGSWVFKVPEPVVLAVVLLVLVLAAVVLAVAVVLLVLAVLAVAVVLLVLVLAAVLAVLVVLAVVQPVVQFQSSVVISRNILDLLVRENPIRQHRVCFLLC